MRKLLNSVSLLSVLIAAPIVTMSAATAEDKLEALTKSEDNWVMQGKNYSSNHYSTLTQINADNVKNLKVAWSFSTGLLSGHEGAPLVVDGKMYVHTSFPEQHLRARPQRPDPHSVAAQAEAEPRRSRRRLLRRRQSRPRLLARRRQGARR